jgi:hypothetical protein
MSVTGFQKQVNVVQAPAVEGDFASANPRFTVLSGPDALVSGPVGTTIGKFAWLNADGRSVSSAGVGVPTGFAYRRQQGLITTPDRYRSRCWLSIGCWPDNCWH